MPIYNYRCKDCKQEFELLVRSSTVAACTACGSQALDKLVSLTSAPSQSAGIIAAGRKAAAKEGHFSNYSASERRRIK